MSDAQALSTALNDLRSRFSDMRDAKSEAFQQFDAAYKKRVAAGDPPGMKTEIAVLESMIEAVAKPRKTPTKAAKKPRSSVATALDRLRKGSG